jgi:hypothetical protein
LKVCRVKIPIRNVLETIPISSAPSVSSSTELGVVSLVAIRKMRWEKGKEKDGANPGPRPEVIRSVRISLEARIPDEAFE